VPADPARSDAWTNPHPGAVTPDPGDLSSLRRRAIGGSCWTIVGLGGANVLRLIGNVVLARLLFPEAFGLMALAQVFLQGLWLFTDVGTGPAIVQSERGDEPEFLDTAWSIQLLRGVVLCLVSFALAWPVSTFYGMTDPLARDLLWYLPALGLTAVLDGAVSTRLHSYSRHLRVKELTLLELHNQALSMIVMVVVAWVHPSVWALVAGAWVKCALRTGLSHALLEGPRHRLRIDRESARAQLRFGKWVLVSTMLTFLVMQADRLLFGRLVSLELLGVYGIALALASLPTLVLSQVGAKVVFPVLSRLDPGRRTSEATRIRALLVVGGAVVLSTILPAGPALIDLLYDARYAAAGWILQVLLIGSWFQLLDSPNTAFLLARGETRVVAASNAVKLVAILALMPLGFALGGFPTAILGLVLADVARYAYTVVLARRRELHVLRFDVGLSAMALAASAAGLAAARLVDGPLACLVASVVGAAAAWCLAGAIAWPRLRRALVTPSAATAGSSAACAS
jgi:O-antigen/teichoic acid export membrane protein